MATTAATSASETINRQPENREQRKRDQHVADAGQRSSYHRSQTRGPSLIELGAAVQAKIVFCSK